MLATVSHALSATTPDDPTYEIRPSHWNSGHNVTLSLQSNDYPVFSAGPASANLSSVVFSNSNGVSFGLNGSTITGTVKTDYQSSGAYLTTAMQSNAATISNINVSAGASSANVSAVTFSNLNGVTFGYDKTNLTASIDSTSGAGTGFTTTTAAGVVIAGTHDSVGLKLAVPGYLTTAALSANTSNYAGINSAITGGSMTVNTSGVSVNIPHMGFGASNTGNTAGNTGTSSGINWVIAGTNNVTVSESTAVGGPNTLWLSAPAGGQATVSQFMPFPHITGSGIASHNPSSVILDAFSVPCGVAVSRIDMFKSMNVSVPAATSAAASTGTEKYSFSKGITLFTRQDYGANSTRLSYWTTASWGMSANMTYAGTSQGISLSWVTNTTGGTTSFNTTSNAGNWSNFFTGIKLIQIPLVTTLSAGEYFIAFGKSSSASTTNSAVTLFSLSDYMLSGLQSRTFGTFSSSGSLTGSQAMGWNIGFGGGTAVGSDVNSTATVGANKFGPAAIGVNFFQFMGAAVDSA